MVKLRESERKGVRSAFFCKLQMLARDLHFLQMLCRTIIIILVFLYNDHMGGRRDSETYLHHHQFLVLYNLPYPPLSHVKRWWERASVRGTRIIARPVRRTGNSLI